MTTRTANGTVRKSGLRLHSSQRMGRATRVLKRSARVEILGEQTWYRVRTSDGKVGLVAADHVDRDPPKPKGDFGPGRADGACQLERYHHPQVIGKPAIVDLAFFPALDRLAGYAAAAGVLILITSATRDPGGLVNGAIVKPADRSNHLVGHAIDFNLQTKDGRIFNSARLKDLGKQPAPVRKFIAAVRADAGLRWGGDFSQPDVVHIDDGLNVRNPTTWAAKLASRR